MPLSDPLLVVGATAMRSAITHVSLAASNPEPSGGNQALCARQPATWNAVTAGGDFTLAAGLNFTSGLANGPVTHVCFWNAVGTGSPPSGGTYYGSQAVSGDPTFNSNGDYSVTAITINGNST